MLRDRSTISVLFAGCLIPFLTAVAAPEPIPAPPAASAGQGAVRIVLASGLIAGRVVHAETGHGVSGASVTVPGTIASGRTDLGGNFVLAGVPVGECTVQVTRDGFRPATVTGVVVAQGQSTRIDVPLPVDTDVVKMEAFTVSAQVVQSSGLGLLSVRQKAGSVSDAIGSDQMTRLGFGTAAAAMKAITGASVVGGKYVYVRGLGERYSTTLVNGVEVPSADPDRRAVNMDMFPSDLVDAIVTTKTFTPDKPGNFSGGAVDLKTKEFPEQLTFSVSASTSFNPRVTGRDFLTYPGGDLAWGRDDGTRALPEALVGAKIPLRFTGPAVDAEIGRLTRLFQPVMSPTTDSAPLNRSLGMALGGLWQVFGRNLGLAASLSYDRTFSGYSNGVLARYERQGVNDPALGALVYMDDSRSEDEALLGGIVNLAYQFSADHMLALNTMFNQSGRDIARRQSGLNVAGGGISETEIFTTRTLKYTERSLGSYQLQGKHLFPQWRELRLVWSATRASTTQDEPDTRYFSTFQTQDGNQFFEASGLPRPSRYFRAMKETRNDFSVDLTLPVPLRSGRELQLKAGWALADTDRDFQERLFEYNSTVLRYDGNEAGFLRDSQVGQVDPATGRLRQGQLYLVETTSEGNSYTGAQEVSAVYAMADAPLGARWRLIGGLRRETTALEVRSRDPRRKVGMLDNDDALPSLNVVYAADSRTNVRFAATRTLARPNFREIADYTSFEFVGDFVYIGNPDLRRTRIANYDLRWERFPRAGELLALSLFHKEMKDPIERGVFSIVNAGELQYQNAPRGEVTGIEVEARRRFDFLAPGLDCLSGGFNYTYVRSSVDIAAAELAFLRYFDKDAQATRPLTGQSPFLVNLDLTYSGRRSGTTASLYYNLFGKRLSLIAPPGTPNVYERPAPTLDFVLTQRLGARVKLTFSAKNLLDSAFEETYRYRDVEYQRAWHRRGRTFSIGATCTY